MSETIIKLEQRCDELELSLSKEKTRISEQERGRKREYRRARSVPGRDPAIASREFRGLPSRISEQDAVAASFRIRLEVERIRCRQAEAELSSVLAENRDLSAQIQELTSNAERSKINLVPDEHFKSAIDANKTTEIICSECKKVVGPPLFAEPFEHDLEELPRGTGRLVRLKNGGSAFGSRDSLYRIGLEPDDATPGREVCSAILAAGFQQVQSPDSEVHHAKDGGGSLLAELEEQYRKLVIRYESLIEVKSESSAQAESNKVSSRPQDLPLNTPDLTAGHFANGPPEYKRLFREIFEILRRSADFPSSTADK